MARIVGVLVVFGLTALIVWGIFKLAEVAKQRKLYRHNPEFSDLPRPIVRELTSQKQQLDSARRIMQSMLDDEINVFLPDPHKSRVQKWITTNTKEISK